jgi:ATP-dependent Lon protease
LSEHGISRHAVSPKPRCRDYHAVHPGAGVRNLEREIANVFRKVVRKIAEGKVRSCVVTPKNLQSYIGIPKHLPEAEQEHDEVGVATGLAWTEAGGDIIYIEATTMKGKGVLTLTGHLGDVMKESAHAALSYIRSRQHEIGVKPDVFGKHDIHIHVPAGAIPKDGPSAGVTMATALRRFTEIRCGDVAAGGHVARRVLPSGAQELWQPSGRA